MDLKMYEICAELSSDFLETVKKAFFFDDGNASLFLTNTGSLYAIGKYFKKYLGVGLHFKPKKLVKVTFPAAEKIYDIASRGTFCVALTNNGSVFNWGSETDTPEYVSCLRDVCAVQISCGEDFMMALSSNGQVWAWKGMSFTCYTIYPKEDDVLESDISPTIAKIDGVHRPIILTEGGKIYMPPTPFDEALPPFIILCRPVGRLISKEKITKLVCGKFRAFALSFNGGLYTWNEYTCTERVTPEQIGYNLGRISDLTALLDVDEVIVKTTTEKYYQIIRQYGRSTLWNSIEIKLRSFKEYQAISNRFLYGHKDSWDIPIEASSSSNGARSRWFRKWASAFNNPEESDITFVVQGKMIYAHNVMLSLQCFKLKKIFNCHYKDSLNRTIVPIDHFSHLTFLRFLKFIYHGYLDIGSHQGNIELLKLVAEYEYEPLLDLCQEIVLRGICDDNACSLYALASQLGLKKMCKVTLKYIEEHLDDMVKNGYYDGLGKKP